MEKAFKSDTSGYVHIYLTVEDTYAEMVSWYVLYHTHH